MQFDQVNNELYKTKDVMDKVILKSQYSDSKINEMAEKLAKVEVFNEGLVFENERLNSEITNLNNTLEMYKNLIMNSGQNPNDDDGDDNNYVNQEMNMANEMYGDS